MNKKLITLAIAAAMAAPAAALAEATLYGKAHVSLDYVDVDDYATWGGRGGVPYGGGNFSLDNAVTAYGDGGFIPGNPNGVGINITPGTTVPVGTEGTQVLGVIPASDLNTVLNNAPAGSTQVVDPATGELVGFDIAGVGVVGTEEASFLYGGATRAYNDAYNNIIRAGGTAEEADVNATAAQYRFANQNATSAQKLDALAYARTLAGSNRFKGWGLNQNHRASRIGVKGSEDLGSGLKAIYQIEMGVDLANENRDGDIDNGNRGQGFYLRNTFVGLAGNFGTFLMGRHDTPLKISTGKLDLFADTLADYNYTIGFHDVRADSAVAYISPSWSGFQFAGAVIPSGGATPTGAWNADADGIADAWSLAAIYNNGPFYASVAYERLGDEHWKTAITPFGYDQETTYRGLYGRNPDDDNKWRVGLGLLDWNGFTLTGVYEGRSNVLGAPTRADSNLWQVQAGYAFGNNMIKGMYGQSDNDSCADPFGTGFRFTCDAGLGLAEAHDTDAWAVGFDHNFSKRTKAYALYTAVDGNDNNNNGDTDWSGFSLGMIHSF